MLALLGASEALAVEGAVSAELTVGARQFSLNANLELSPVLDRLWLVAGYGLLKGADYATEATGRVPTAASHLLHAGVDVSPHKSWIFSLLAQVSPRAMETVVLNPGATVDKRVELTSSRQSAGGTLSVVFDTAGDSDFELGLDAGVGFTWNRLGRRVAYGALRRERFAHLFVTRPQLGAAAVIKDQVTLGVRAGYSFYSADPLTVGRLSWEDFEIVAAALRDSGSEDAAVAEALALLDRFASEYERNQGAANGVLARLAAFDSLTGYAYAPVLFDLKSSVLVKVTRRLSLQLAWTWLRYVPTQGYGNVIALKVQFRFPPSWRAWISGSVQLDEPLDRPAQRRPEDPTLSVSGHLSIGAELAFF